MKHSKTTVAAFALVLTALALGAKDGITLKRTLKAGTETYKFETTGKTTLSMPGGGDQDMGMTTLSTYKYKISDPDATSGLSPVEVTYKVDKFDVDGPLAEIMAGQKDKILVTTTSNGKLDTKNRYAADPTKKVDPRSVLNGSSAFAIVSPYFEFPDKALSPGDTWDITIPKGPLTSSQDQKITAKFIGEKDGGYSISITGSVKFSIDVGALLKDNPVPELTALGAVNLEVKGSTDVSGDIVIDKTTFQTVSMTFKLATKQETSLPDQGMSIPSTGTTTVKITADKESPPNKEKGSAARNAADPFYFAKLTVKREVWSSSLSLWLAPWWSSQPVPRAGSGLAVAFLHQALSEARRRPCQLRGAALGSSCRRRGPTQSPG